MENKEIQPVINGQPGERPIADEIKNVLYNSPDSDEWRRDFESQWQYVIFVLYQPSLTGAEPSAVALVVIPDPNENEFYFDQLSFRVRLVGVQDAVGVWPAIERLGQRLSEIGRLLKGIVTCSGWCIPKLRSRRCASYLRRAKATCTIRLGLNCSCARPAMLKIRVGLLGLLTMWRLQDTLKQLFKYGSAKLLPAQITRSRGSKATSLL